MTRTRKKRRLTAAVVGVAAGLGIPDLTAVAGFLG
jgi:hypothetical protein